MFSPGIFKGREVRFGGDPLTGLLVFTRNLQRSRGSSEQKLHSSFPLPAGRVFRKSTRAYPPGRPSGRRSRGVESFAILPSSVLRVPRLTRRWLENSRSFADAVFGSKLRARFMQPGSGRDTAVRLLPASVHTDDAREPGEYRRAWRVPRAVSCVLLTDSTVRIPIIFCLRSK